MIAVDTNILVHAHRAESPFHDQAFACIRQLAEGDEPWLIPWPCVHEFLVIVTHPRIYAPPTPLDAAVRQVEHWLQSPSLMAVGETTSHWRTLSEIVLRSKVTGPTIHDARVAAICLDNGTDMLWTADRDFSRFPQLPTRNPLV